MSTKHGVTQVELQGARDELVFLRGYQEGIIPTTCPASRSGSDREAVAPSTARRALRRAHKKSNPNSRRHTQTVAAAKLAEVEDELDDALHKGESTQTELQAMQDRIENLIEYQGGLTATNDGLCRNLAEVPAAEPYYAQIANNDKCAF